VQQSIGLSVKSWACKLAVDMFLPNEKDLIEDLDGILKIGDFYNRADQEGTRLLFI
jgi:peroxiredoxin family protein